MLRGHQIQIEALAEDRLVDGFLYQADETIAIPADQPHSKYLDAIWGRQLDLTVRCSTTYNLDAAPGVQPCSYRTAS